MERRILQPKGIFHFNPSPTMLYLSVLLSFTLSRLRLHSFHKDTSALTALSIAYNLYSCFSFFFLSIPLIFSLSISFFYSFQLLLYFFCIFREWERVRTMRLIVHYTMAWTMRASSTYNIYYYFIFISYNLLTFEYIQY